MRKKDCTESTLAPFSRLVEGGLELRLKVVPGAKREGVVGIYGDRLRVRVNAPPEQGKANRAVEKLIEKWSGAKSTRIIAGHGSAEKIIFIAVVYKLPELE